MTQFRDVEIDRFTAATACDGLSDIVVDRGRPFRRSGDRVIDILGCTQQRDCAQLLACRARIFLVLDRRPEIANE